MDRSAHHSYTQLPTSEAAARHALMPPSAAEPADAMTADGDLGLASSLMLHSDDGEAETAFPAAKPPGGPHSEDSMVATAALTPAGKVANYGFFQLVVMGFFWVSGGCYGNEELFDMGPPALVLPALIIVPLLFSVPTALITTELTSAMPLDGGVVCPLCSLEERMNRRTRQIAPTRTRRLLLRLRLVSADPLHHPVQSNTSLYSCSSLFRLCCRLSSGELRCFPGSAFGVWCLESLTLFVDVNPLPGLCSTASLRMVLESPLCT